MPIYFNYLAGNAGVSDVDYLAYWGYAVSVSTVVVAILGPVLGTFSDFPGWKKKIFLTVLLIGAWGVCSWDSPHPGSGSAGICHR